MITLILLNVAGFALASAMDHGKKKIQQDKDIKDLTLSMYAEVMKIKDHPTAQAMRDHARSSRNTNQGIIDALDKIES